MINNGNFAVIESQNKHGKTTFKLSVINPEKRLPLITTEIFETMDIPEFIITIMLKNLFDSVNFLLPENLQSNSSNGKNVKNTDGIEHQSYTFEKYKEYIQKSRVFYYALYHNSLAMNKDLGIKSLNIITDEETGKDFMNTEVSKHQYIPIPCESDYGFNLLKTGLFNPSIPSNPSNPSILKNDFVFENAGFFSRLYDVIYIHYNNSETFLPRFENPYLDESGKIEPTVIIDDTIPVPDLYQITDDPKKIKKWVIIGRNNSKCNFNFSQTTGFNDVLEDQAAHYEEWVKEYTYQELHGSIPRESISFGDYITNKKNLAGVDYKYIEAMNARLPKENPFLDADSLRKLKDYVKWKTNKMCEGKFNKPNMKLSYIWHIVEITIDIETKLVIDVANAVNHLRELNEFHTPLLQKIQLLSWTEMLERNNIVRPKENVGLDFKQVFTEFRLDGLFYLISHYLHPLNYKTNYYYTENKIFTIEDLIQNSQLKCDGLYHGMEKYKGLPFYAVVPIEFTNYCNIVNSSNYFKGRKCHISDSLNSLNSLSLLPQARESKSNNNNDVPWARSPRTRKNVIPPRTRGTAWNSLLVRRTRMRNHVAYPVDYTDLVLDKTIYLKAIPKANAEEQQTFTPEKPNIEFLRKLFTQQSHQVQPVEKQVKVYSSFITGNGLIVCILLVDKTFYYVLMEVNIKGLTRDKLELIRKYNFYSIYGVQDNTPLINIYLIKDFTPGDKTFSSLGNECIYKLFSNMDEFYSKEMIDLNYGLYDARNSQIPNIYRVILIQIINMINSIRNADDTNWFSDKLDDDSPEIQKYYRVRNTETEEIKMINEAELDRIRETMEVYTEAIPEKLRDETISILTPVLKNNNVFITIGKDMVFIINKFSEDVLKMDKQYIPPNKKQLANFYKFTIWILPKSYIRKCIEILKQFYNFSLQNPLVRIDDALNQLVIYHVSSLEKYNLEEFNAHLMLHNKFIKDFVISKDISTLCKSYSPSISVNPFSDISSSILHLHIRQNIMHLDILKILNFKYELLHSKNRKSIYNNFSDNSYSLNKLFNNLKCFKSLSLLNPYVQSFKLSALFGLAS